ncbi:hypothetical protein [Lelliottia wanjuensis]|uniref:hypothetical protein n=1 Tax=Lelliottia wanjuensis TaxID=3050585 RepID=UPI00254D0F77|nr:hypothetical protein [Lelliottia sp. V106_16]MDK9356743.1 hypothetical protein [Lelliottia sp. V106_16]
MKIENLIDFLLSHGVGEYQVSVLPDNRCVARPLTDNQIVVDPEMIMEMIAARDAKNSRLDL